MSSVTSSPMDYKLPSPHINQEFNHKMWLGFIGGLYPSYLDSMVERRMSLGRGAMILDVGCGSGIWAMEMATRFPKAEVIGVDIAPVKYGSGPPNFKFEGRNLVDGLPKGYLGRFDIIHCRTVCQHMREPQEFINNLVKCLKPGGLILVPDGEWAGFDENNKPLDSFIYDPKLSTEENISNTRKLSAFGGWLKFFGDIITSPKYRLPDVLLRNTGAVKDIVFKEYWAPVGWAGKGVPRGEEIGDIMRLNMTYFFEASAEVILNHGVPEAVVKAWRDRAAEEFDEKRQMVWSYTSGVAHDVPAARL